MPVVAAAPSITARAYAKINLALLVSAPEPADSRRPGWHAIASWMHAIDLFDELRVTRLSERQTSRLEIAWADDAPHKSPLDWPHEIDLASRAHRLLEGLAGQPLPVAISLTKRIPVGGGLGGGSSDAAAALLAINELFDLGLERAALARHAAGIGSDVAYFIDDPPPRPAFVGGFGDRIERTPRAEAPLLLIIPPFGCATPAVYRAYDAQGPHPLDERPVRDAAREARPDPAALRNDLVLAAERVEPRLVDVRRRVERACGLPVHMSGSGSTLFVLAGHEAARPLREALPASIVVPSTLI